MPTPALVLRIWAASTGVAGHAIETFASETRTATVISRPVRNRGLPSRTMCSHRTTPAASGRSMWTKKTTKKRRLLTTSSARKVRDNGSGETPRESIIFAVPTATCAPLSSHTSQ